MLKFNDFAESTNWGSIYAMLQENQFKFHAPRKINVNFKLENQFKFFALSSERIDVGNPTQLTQVVKTIPYSELKSRIKT